MRLFRKKEQNPWIMQDPDYIGYRTIRETFMTTKQYLEDRLREEQAVCLRTATKGEVAMAEAKAASALERERERSSSQSKIDTLQRERDLAYVRIAELESRSNTLSADARNVYELKAKIDAEKISFLNRAFEESQRAQLVAQKEILDLRQRVSDREKPFISKYEDTISVLEELVELWKKKALEFEAMRCSKGK